MRLARNSNEKPIIGNKNGFVSLSAAEPELTNISGALPKAAKKTLPDPNDAPVRKINQDQINFNIPLKKLGKLWGIGLNYMDHASDLDEDWPEEPASFMKPSTAAVGPGGPIRLPPKDITKEVTAEAELGVVIGCECSGISKSEVDNVIAGFVPIIDITAEDILQKNPRFLTRSKSFDSFIVIGPWIKVFENRSCKDLGNIKIQTIINDDVVAENQIENMRFPPNELVSFHSRTMTLTPGDIISTGTPGAHKIESDDEVKAKIEDVGSVSADVV